MSGARSENQAALQKASAALPLAGLVRLQQTPADEGGPIRQSGATPAVSETCITAPGIIREASSTLVARPPHRWLWGTAVLGAILQELTSFLRWSPAHHLELHGLSHYILDVCRVLDVDCHFLGLKGIFIHAEVAVLALNIGGNEGQHPI